MIDRGGTDFLGASLVMQGAVQGWLRLGLASEAALQLPGQLILPFAAFDVGHQQINSGQPTETNDG